jgi:hypothetical protein
MNDDLARPTAWRLLVAGGTMLGPLRTPLPTDDLDAATKAYVDSKLAAGSSRDGELMSFGTTESATTHRWYGALAALGTTAVANVRGIAQCTPLWLGTNQTWSFDALLCSITSAGATGAVMRMGVYELDPSTLTPTTLLVDAGTVSSASTGIKTITLGSTLTSSSQWLGLAIQGEGATSPGTPAGYGSVSSGSFTPILGINSSGSVPNLTAIQCYGYQHSLVADGALPPSLSSGWEPRYGAIAGVLIRRLNTFP